MESILAHNLDIPYDFFWKELLRDKGFTIGRLDSRYRGIDREKAGEGPDFNAELTSWLHSFTPAIQIYMRNDLNYKTDLKYNMFGSSISLGQQKRPYGGEPASGAGGEPLFAFADPVGIL